MFALRQLSLASSLVSALASSPLGAAATGVCAFAGVLASANSAHAEVVYWSLEQLLVDFFPAAERVTYAQFSLTDADLATLEARLGYRPATDWTIFIATLGGEAVGYAIVDNELGLHEPISFGVRFDAALRIDRMEVMVYREPYGDEVRDRRFLQQFEGRDWTSELSIDSDIAAISGATISSRSLAAGARRASAVLSVILESRGNLLAFGPG